MEKTYAFVARFWQEPEEEQKWRGVLILVQTGERFPVQSVEEAMQLIQSFLKGKNVLDPEEW